MQSADITRLSKNLEPLSIEVVRFKSNSKESDAKLLLNLAKSHGCRVYPIFGKWTWFVEQPLFFELFPTD